MRRFKVAVYIFEFNMYIPNLTYLLLYFDFEYSIYLKKIAIIFWFVFFPMLFYLSEYFYLGENELDPDQGGTNMAVTTFTDYSSLTPRFDIDIDVEREAHYDLKRIDCAQYFDVVEYAYFV